MTTATYTTSISALPEVSPVNAIKKAGASLHTISIKDPGSAITHFIGAIASIVAAPFLIQHAVSHQASASVLISLSIFAASLILLYSASTLYHSVMVSREAEMVFKKVDHMSIFILIAGTYTPLCMTVLRSTCGIALLIAIWTVALLGILFKFFWVTCPKWISSVMYIGMGWLVVLAFPWLLPALTTGGFLLLLFGGILYTVGGVIYALKVPFFEAIHPNFGTHEVFHVFVMAGSLLHFIMIYSYIY